jgi:RNA ligase (TIGR02306 family)
MEIRRKLATIEKIAEIHPITDADAIERAVIRGWNVVIKKGDFKVGDLCVYCEIDSVMPEQPEFEFLRPRNFRIRTVKLRGQISQGIAFPLNIIPMGVIRFTGPENESYLDCSILTEEGDIRICEPGLDVTDLLGITKYDPPIPAELAGIAKGNFPSHSIKTDEERIQNLIDHYAEYRKNKWILTEKLDGTSGTFFVYNNDFGIASRNLELAENEVNSFWKVARRIGLEEKMRAYMQRNSLDALTLQGELIGEGIQGNKYKLKGQDIRFFRSFDPIKYQFFPYWHFLLAMNDMNLQEVPILATDFTLPESYEELIAFCDGKSKLADTAREGIVFVSENPSYNDNGRLSFKIISNKFLIKHEE